MVTLGMVLGKFIVENPRLVIMPTRKLESGRPVEVEGIKLATIDGKQVLVLTI